MAARVVESGPADEVLSRPRTPYSRQLLFSAPVPDPEAQRARRAAAQVSGAGTTQHPTVARPPGLS